MAPLAPGDEQPTSISVIPMFHIYGFAVNALHGSFLGAKQVILPRCWLPCLATS